MSFSTASLLRSYTHHTPVDAGASHDHERYVTFANDHSLYISRSATHDRRVLFDHSEPLFSVRFSDERENTCVPYEVAQALALQLNVGPALTRREILGKPDRICTSSLDSYIRDGAIFAHNPIVGEPLELCLVPLAVTHRSSVRVLPLRCVRNLWVVKTIR